MLQQRFEVRFEYPVVFTHDALSPDNPRLVQVLGQAEAHRRHRVFCVLDAGLLAAWPDLVERLRAYVDRHDAHLELGGPPLVLPGGEACKRDERHVHQLHAALEAAALDRHCYVLALGGGALLDAVGYGAATFHRGVRLVRMPTTVLAQNDAGVGVKNGINAFGKKNFLGTFAPPHAVINDAAFLSTLEPRDLRAGMAEAVKVGLIRDAAFFRWLQEQREALAQFDRSAMNAQIQRAAQIHLEHIAQSGDPFERGSARPLDFGHWAAHKLESLTEHALRHGEAVAIGMALDSRYSFLAGWLEESELRAIVTLLEGLGFPLWHEALGERDADGSLGVLHGLQEFREHMGGELNIPMLAGIGRTRDVREVDLSQMEAALEWLRARSVARCA